jgi:Gpi18-like mannosyltransferase
MRAKLASSLPGERRESLGLLLWRLDTPAGLVAMFAVAFLVRVLLAPHVGFYGDLRLFQTWTAQLAEVGTQDFYDQGQFVDYPPGYLYVLWLTGKISATPGYLLLKLPAILADLGLAWIAGTLAARIAPTSVRERFPVRALVAAAVLFNPAVIALSAGWGQVDAVPAMFVLWSLLLTFTGAHSLRRDITAFLLFAVAISMKPQTSLVLPVMLYALYRRYLHRRARPELIDGALSLGLIAAPSLALWAVSGLAFGLGPISLLRFYQDAASVYPVTSANAFNLWGALGSWRNDSTGDDVMAIAGISALHFGMLLFAAGIVLVLWRVHRAIGRGAVEARVLMVAATILGLLAYTLLTRMHERYVFVALACLAVLAFARPLRLSYALLSALFLLNLWYPYAFFNSQWGVQDFHFQPWFDWIFGGFANDTWQRTIWSLAVTAIVFATAWVGLRWAERSPAGERAPTGDGAEPDSRLAGRLRRRRELAPAAEAAAAVRLKRLARWALIALVGLACLFGLVVLRAETETVQHLNDSAFHLQMVRWADGQIEEGRVPLDGWFPDLSLGSPFFHHYQSLPETLTAYAARATGASDQGAYQWILYLLLALWPISVYLGTRLLDWDGWTAAAAAAVAPLIVSASGYGYEHSSYTFRGYGVYSQLWAMWLLPIAWGLTWRAVSRGRYYAVAAAALALTIACHFITGYLALLTLGVWVLVAAGPFVPRVGRAAVVGGGSLLVAAWVLVPLLADAKWSTQSEFYKGSVLSDSYGGGQVLEWLFTGGLFDHERFPIVTLLFFVGVVVCAARARHDPRARALLGAFALSLLLFFGRPTLGPLLDLLPGFGDVQIHRFVIGVHLAGIMLAGVGLAWLLRSASRWAARLAADRVARSRFAVGAAAASLLACVAVLAPAWIERADYDSYGADLIRAQQAAERTDGRDIDRLLAMVNARGDGRVYAGLRSNWGKDFLVGVVPVYAWLCDRDVDAIGFTFRTIASLSNDTEAAFDETNPAHYEMFNVRYVILPPGRRPDVRATHLATSGRYRLWEVATSGYFQVVDRAAPFAANRTNLLSSVQGFMGSDLAAEGVYPGVAFAGEAEPRPTFAGSAPPPGAAGTVVAQTHKSHGGVFTATVEASRPGVVLLKASYDPRWTVTVDGLPDEATMMAPSLVGVEVPAGRHEVRFRYEPYGHYPLLVVIGALTLLALALVPRRAALFPRRESRSDDLPPSAGGDFGYPAVDHDRARRQLHR